MYHTNTPCCRQMTMRQSQYSSGDACFSRLSIVKAQMLTTVLEYRDPHIWLAQLPAFIYSCCFSLPSIVMHKKQRNSHFTLSSDVRSSKSCFQKLLIDWQPSIRLIPILKGKAKLGHKQKSLLLFPSSEQGKSATFLFQGLTKGKNKKATYFKLNFTVLKRHGTKGGVTLHTHLALISSYKENCFQVYPNPAPSKLTTS